MKKIFVYYFICLAIFSCKTKTTETQKDIFAANIDSTVNPGDDFFQYALM